MTPEEISRDQLSIKQLANEMQALNAKMDGIWQLMEDLARENSPCNQKKKANDSMDQIMKLVEDSPLNKHPMFAEMLKPLMDIISVQKA